MSEALLTEGQNQQPPKTELTPALSEPYLSLTLNQAFDLSEGDRAVKLARDVTFIKEGFQSVHSTNRDERYSQLLSQEISGVYIFFTDLGMLSPQEDSILRVDAIYRDISKHIEYVDKDVIEKLADKYAAHPVMQGMDMLQKIMGTSYRDHVVHMRRNMLIMLDSSLPAS